MEGAGTEKTHFFPIECPTHLSIGGAEVLPFVARPHAHGIAVVGILIGARGHGWPEDRSYDGSGNNVLNPTWGAAGSDLVRMAPAAYGDGMSSPAGATRENPRAISNTLVSQSGPMPNTMNLSDWVFQWGQFVDHDMTLTDLATPTESMDIPIPMGDPIFDPTSTGTATMAFTRSQYDPTTGLSVGDPRQQVNSNSSYLDGSVIYGSSEDRAMALRTMSGGHLLTSAGDMLPYNTMGLTNADNGDPNQAAYHVAGDVRVNEQIGITSVQTLFMREHNRVADELAAEHPTWTDDQLYQQARHVVGAEIQSITYQEFLPALLGNQAPGITSTYDAAVNATVMNEFATALFRVGHTMIPSNMPMMQNDGTPAPGGDMPLADAFFNPSLMDTSTELEYMLKGLASEKQQQIDIHVVDDVRNFLFGDPIPGGGFDLAALDIERGRDNGLADYNTVREAFGLPAVSSFDQITSDYDLQQALEAIYGDVNNIDPWVGALCEDHLPGEAVGALVSAAMVQQFTNLRDGDRFFFTNDTELTPDELLWIENLHLSDIIRLNTGITNLQTNVFVVPEPGTFALGLVALGGLALLARRRRARRHA